MTAEVVDKKNHLAPIICRDSGFFINARGVRRSFDQILEGIVISKDEVLLPKSSTLVDFRGDLTYATARSLELYLPDFPEELEKPEIVVVSSPDSNAVTLGSIGVREDGTFGFLLPRLVRGPVQQDNIRQSVFQGAGAGPIRKMVEECGDHPKDSIYVVNLTREGHVTDIQRAFRAEYDFDVPTTLVSIKHLEVDANESEGFGRVAVIFPPNYEGLNPETVCTLVFSDPVASGLQIVALGENIVSSIRDSGGQNLKRILVVAPLLTLFGASTIASWAASEGLSTTFLTSGTVLNCLGPEYYFSPVFINEPKLTPNSDLLRLNEQAHGVAAGKACAGGNWTANLFAEKVARAMSERELSDLGTSEDQLLAKCNEITADTIRQAGLDPMYLVPSSTWRMARTREKATALLKFLQS